MATIDPERTASTGQVWYPRLNEEAYNICKERGHEASMHMTTGTITYSFCKHCGVKYYYTEPQLTEVNVPETWEGDNNV